MTKIAQIDDHGSVLAWSPVKDYADVVALGTKVSYLCFGAGQKLFRLFVEKKCPRGTAGGIHNGKDTNLLRRREGIPCQRIESLRHFDTLEYLSEVFDVLGLFIYEGDDP